MLHCVHQFVKQPLLKMMRSIFLKVCPKFNIILSNISIGTYFSNFCAKFCNRLWPKRSSNSPIFQSNIGTLEPILSFFPFSWFSKEADSLYFMFSSNLCGEQAKDILHNNQFSDNIDSIGNTSLFTHNI